jgi:hypothetical protein
LMKTKLYKILGVALTLVLLASLTAGLATIPAGAASSNLKFTKLELPMVEDWTDHASFVDSEGDFWATPGIDLGPIAQTPDGNILFAAVADGFYLVSPWFDVLKSTDGGYSWIPTGFYDEWFDASDSSPIVDMVTSPDYNEDTTVFVATAWSVYQSVDGGKNFICMEDSPAWGGNITDLDVSLDDRGRLAVMVGTTAGDVFVLATATGQAWEDQGIDIYSGGCGVLACDFLPGFADNEGISCVYNCAGGTWMSFSFGYLGEPFPENGWGVDIMDAHFTDAVGDPFSSVYARTAFPDDFDPWGVGSNVCFVGIATQFDQEAPLSEDGGDAYKVVLKEAGLSSAIDLDVRGVVTTLLPTATNIISIDVCGDAEAATIMVGTDTCNLTDTPESWFVYNSTDSGDSWMFSFKAPTGGSENIPDLSYGFAMTRVLMAPDFCDTGLAYASTWGYQTDAFQRTTDGGASWNQISIIDYGDGTDGYAITAPTGFNAYGYNADGTLWMITQDGGDNGALWGRLDGKRWERILSYATPGVTDTLRRLDILGDGSAMFATDLANGLIWRSTDMGATFPKKISTKPDLQTVTAVSATTLYTGNMGEIWWSTKSGTGWTKPDDSEIPNAPVIQVGVMGDVVLAGTVTGQVFISSNGGETMERIGTDGPFVGGPTLVTADLGFAGNGILYSTNVSPSADVMRTVVDLSAPGDAEWVQIDDNQASTGAVVYDETNFAAGGPALALPPSGVLYVIDATPVDTDEGGLWRSTNATADTDSVAPPYFERENKGLDNGDALGLLSLDLAPPALAPTFFCSNAGVGVPYNEQVVMFTDILNVGVSLASPTADETGVGLLPEGYVYPEVVLLWQEMAGATSYQYQVAIDANFKTKVANDFTNSLATPPMDLTPNMNYYWRVRVADEGSLIGAPLISPWSETWKFKTAIGASMARPELQAPWPGEPDVPLSPTFEWSGIEWAEVYEYELAIDPTTTAGGYFTTPLVALVGTNSLVSTAWKSDITLDYDTRYYWHVKAIGVDTDTPWSDVGTFTTIGVAPPPPTSQPPVVIPPAENITPAWIWAIVIIGAILVIAVIVLIVTTRRVP